MAVEIIDSSARCPIRDGTVDPLPLLESMDAFGIAKAVIAPPDEFVAVNNQEGNQRIAEAVKRYPARFAGLAVANPWLKQGGVRILEHAFDTGFNGLYINPGRQGFHLSEAIVDPLLEVCSRRGKPVYSYTGTPVCCEPFQLSELARRFPNVQFIMGHGAWSDFWYDVLPAASQAPNVYVETSCIPAHMVSEIIQGIGCERVIFGSGYPRSLHQNELKKMNLVGISEEQRMRVFMENARELWRL
jgi:predicted TIM-barrel fold metal-dependent hydrolase